VLRELKFEIRSQIKKPDAVLQALFFLSDYARARLAETAPVSDAAATSSRQTRIVEQRETTEVRRSETLYNIARAMQQVRVRCACSVVLS
jgi:hypothetical protein